MNAELNVLPLRVRVDFGVMLRKGYIPKIPLFEMALTLLQEIQSVYSKPYRFLEIAEESGDLLKFRGVLVV